MRPYVLVPPCAAPWCGTSACFSAYACPPSKSI